MMSVEKTSSIFTSVEEVFNQTYQQNLQTGLLRFTLKMLLTVSGLMPARVRNLSVK